MAVSLILGFNEHGKPCITNDCHVYLLKSFQDVLKDSFRGKKFTYRIDSGAPVPEQSLELWRSRGYEPACTGIAHVVFEQTPGKTYDYPAYFWSE